MRYINSAVLVTAVVGGLIYGGEQVDAASLTSGEYNQINHYNIPQGFMNDIQSIFKGSDGYYHIYYLANDRYKNSGDGTEWYHVKTKDFEHFENVGVSIPKFSNGWSAVATGSVVKNDNGFYKDLPKTAVIAYFTSYTPTGQHQYAAYSLDDGVTYKPYNGTEPVMKSTTATSDNRDPYVFYNEKTKKMTMYLAEGDKVGTYTSSDGKHFEYQGATILNKFSLGGKDLGLVECPNLKNIYDPTTKSTKQVMFFGANGYNYGQTTGTYYMIGHLDDKGVFVPEQQPKRVDDGSDFYGANFYQDGDSIKSIGWNGNWGYTAGKIVDDNNEESQHLGSFTTARTMTLRGSAGDYSLASHLMLYKKQKTSYMSTHSSSDTATKSDGYNSDLLTTTRWVSQVGTFNFSNRVFNPRGGSLPLTGHIQLNFTQKDGWVRLDYNADNGKYEVTRHSDKVQGESGSNYDKSYVEDSGYINPSSLSIKVISDKDSLEFEFTQNGKTYTMAKISTDDQMTISVKASGDTQLSAQLENIESK